MFFHPKRYEEKAPGGDRKHNQFRPSQWLSGNQSPPTGLLGKTELRPGKYKEKTPNRQKPGIPSVEEHLEFPIAGFDELKSRDSRQLRRRCQVLPQLKHPLGKPAGHLNLNKVPLASLKKTRLTRKKL